VVLQVQDGDLQMITQRAGCPARFQGGIASAALAPARRKDCHANGSQQPRRNRKGQWLPVGLCRDSWALGVTSLKCAGLRSGI
jgi:hypothetical protein